MNTNERIQKLALGGAANSRRDLTEAENLYQSTLAGMDPNDPTTAQRQAKAAAYLEQAAYDSSANPGTNKRERHRAAEAYRVAASMLNGSFNEANVANPYTGGYGQLGGYADADRSALKFENNNRGVGQTVTTGTTGGNRSLGGLYDYTYTWNKGLESGFGETLLARVRGYASTVLENIKKAQQKKTAGYSVNEDWTDAQIAGLTEIINNTTLSDIEAYNKLGHIAETLGETGEHWDAWFGDLKPRDTEAEQNHKAKLKAHYKDFDMNQLSEATRKMLENRKLKIMIDPNNKKVVVKEDYSDYDGGEVTDYNDDYLKANTEGYGYHDGFHIKEDGSIELGNLDAEDLSEDLRNYLLDKQAERSGLRQQLFQRLNWYGDKFETEDSFINELSDKFFNGGDFKGADVSRLFRGDERVFAVPASGSFQADADGNIRFDDNTTFYVKTSNGIEKKTWREMKPSYKQDGFAAEQNQLGKIYGFDEKSLDDLSTGNYGLDTDLGERNYWDAVQATFGAVPIIGGLLGNAGGAAATASMASGPAGWITAGVTALGALAGAGITKANFDSIRDDPASFVYNMLYAIKNNGQGETYGDKYNQHKINAISDNQELYKNFKYLDHRNEIDALIIKLVDGEWSNLTVDSLPAELKETYKAIKKRALRNGEQHEVMGEALYQKKGGKIIKAEDGTILTPDGRDITHPAYVNKVRSDIERKNDKLEKANEAAKAEGYDSVYQKEANDRRVFHGDGTMSTADVMRLGTMAQDVASIVASFVPGAGTGVAAGLGVTSMFTDMAADIIDPAVSKGEVIKNAAMNTGFAAVGMIPGAKMGKVMRSVVKWAPKIIMGASALGIVMDESTQETFKKIADGGKDFNRQDWRNLSHVLSLVAAGTRGARADYKSYQAKKGIIAKDNVKLNGVKASDGQSDLELPKKTVDSINEKLKSAKTVEEAKTTLKNLKNENGGDLFTDAQVKAIAENSFIEENGSIKSKIPGKQKIELNTKKLSETTSKKAAEENFKKISELWNEDAAALREQSKTSTGRAAIWFANKFGGGAYGANQRAILANKELLNDDLVAGLNNLYKGKYNPMIDWRGKRNGLDDFEMRFEEEAPTSATVEERMEARRRKRSQAEEDSIRQRWAERQQRQQQVDELTSEGDVEAITAEEVTPEQLSQELALRPKAPKNVIIAKETPTTATQASLESSKYEIMRRPRSSKEVAQDLQDRFNQATTDRERLEVLDSMESYIADYIGTRGISINSPEYNLLREIQNVRAQLISGKPRLNPTATLGKSTKKYIEAIVQPEKYTSTEAIRRLNSLRQDISNVEAEIAVAKKNGDTKLVGKLGGRRLALMQQLKALGENFRTGKYRNEAFKRRGGIL